MEASGGRSVLATIVGWLIVLIIVWFLFGWIIGAVRVLLRFAVFLVVVGALAALWLRLRSSD